MYARPRGRRRRVRRRVGRWVQRVGRVGRRSELDQRRAALGALRAAGRALRGRDHAQPVNQKLPNRASRGRALVSASVRMRKRGVVAATLVGLSALFWRSDRHVDAPLPLLTPRLSGLPLARAAKVAVLLGGWPDGHELWAGVASSLAEEYHVVSITTPDFDRGALRRRWGYDFAEVPLMIAACLDAHLGASRHIDAVIAHDWGAIWAYYLLQHRGRVGRLVTVEIGASAHDDAALDARIPSVTHSTPWSVPYQLITAALFALGTSVSPALAAALVELAWPLTPYVGPVGGGFNWDRHAPRPRHEVKVCAAHPAHPLLQPASFCEPRSPDRSRPHRAAHSGGWATRTTTCGAAGSTRAGSGPPSDGGHYRRPPSRPCRLSSSTARRSERCSTPMSSCDGSSGRRAAASSATTAAGTGRCMSSRSASCATWVPSCGAETRRRADGEM